MSNPLANIHTHTKYIFGPEAHKANFPLMMIAIVLTMVFAFAIAMIWGLSMLIGLVFIVYAGIIILLNRGNYFDETTIILIVIGIVFIILNFLGITFTMIDFSGFGPAEKIFSIFHP